MRSLAVFATFLMASVVTHAQIAPSFDSERDSDDIAGRVTSSNGPEAGVWVIAETADFETRYAKIVVTDDEGRYLIPDLPQASYQIWARGYELVDSEKIVGEPGDVVEINTTAANPAIAAAGYPAIFWYSLMRLPEETEIAHVNGGINAYLTTMKSGSCVGCHQLGNLATRTIPAALGNFDNSQTAWLRRIQSGQAGPQMLRQGMAELGGTVLIKHLADWTDRVAAGELPTHKPERPRGVERNVVATIRDWADPKSYLHDLVSTDRRNPSEHAYGPLYGSPEFSTDLFPILDPTSNAATTFKAPVRDADTPTTSTLPVLAPSPYWGTELLWNSQAFSHNPMIDHKGRVWYTARIRGPENPDFCRAGSGHPSATAFPTAQSDRHLAVYEPRTGEYTFVDTCFSTHHLQFAEDANNTLWTSGGGEVVGWLNTNLFDETGDAARSQGWTAAILDTNGNGRRDDYVEPGAPADPSRDRRVPARFYAVMPNPVDGSVWGSNFSYPGSIVRIAPGPNPPQTALAEIYNVPLPGFGSRGADIDRKGVVWVSLASGHLGEFDRSKCRGPLNGPAATGAHCPEGWTLHRLPGPGFEQLPEFSAESSYYTWVDQHNTSGLGPDTPIATGNLYDGVHALVGDQFVTLRIPYPLGFYTKGFDGRIDDPDIGWKGRGLWVPSGDRTPWHMEGGKGTKPIVVHFQVRPNPLAH